MTEKGGAAAPARVARVLWRRRQRAKRLEARPKLGSAGRGGTTPARLRRLKYLLLAVPLLLLAVSAWYLGGQGRGWLLPGGLQVAGVQVEGNLSLGADGASVTGLRLVQYDGQRLAWTLNAPRAERLEEQRSLIYDPVLEAFPPQGNALRVTAKRGVVDEASQLVTFEDDVEVREEAEQRRLFTQQLSFDPERRLVSSERSFTYTQPGFSLRGVGLRLYQEERRLRVLHRVRARFRR